MTIFMGCLMAIVAVIAAPSSDRDPRRWLAAVMGVVLAAWTRNLLWIYVGFEAFSLAAARFRAGTLVGSSLSLGGLVVVALAARTTDLAALPSTPAVIGGVCSFTIGLVWKWSSSRDEPLLFLSAGLALVAVVTRFFAWAPAIANALEPAIWLAAILAVVSGGLGAALSAKTRTLARWLTLSMVGLAVVGLASGTTALPHVLSHVAAASLVLALVLAGAPPAATWLAMASLASVPPFPGFVTKLALLAGLSSGTLTWVLVGLVFASVGCMKEIARRRPGKRWVTAAAIAIVVVCGLWPESFLEITARAAAGLF